MKNPRMWGIYRMPGRAALSNRRERQRRFGLMLATPQPKRVAVIEAPNGKAALEGFAKAEQIRSKQVDSWHVAGHQRLVVTLVNGANVHEAVYEAWRQER